MAVDDVLMPGGNPIGTPGGRNKCRPDIREVPGGQKAAEGFFRDLVQGGSSNTPAGYPGIGMDLPGGGWVGLRPVSKSGPPTIDVDVTGVPIKKLKFI